MKHSLSKLQVPFPRREVRYYSQHVLCRSSEATRFPWTNWTSIAFFEEASTAPPVIASESVLGEQYRPVFSAGTFVEFGWCEWVGGAHINTSFWVFKREQHSFCRSPVRHAIKATQVNLTSSVCCPYQTPRQNLPEMLANASTQGRQVFETEELPANSFETREVNFPQRRANHSNALLEKECSLEFNMGKLPDWKWCGWWRQLQMHVCL